MKTNKTLHVNSTAPRHMLVQKTEGRLPSVDGYELANTKPALIVSEPGSVPYAIGIRSVLEEAHLVFSGNAVYLHSPYGNLLLDVASELPSPDKIQKDLVYEDLIRLPFGESDFGVMAPGTSMYEARNRWLRKVADNTTNGQSELALNLMWQYLSRESQLADSAYMFVSGEEAVGLSIQPQAFALIADVINRRVYRA